MVDFYGPALRARIERNIAAAVDFRRKTEAPRAHEGEPPLDITVCLGPGRCLIPTADASATTCPFCYRYPAGNASKSAQKRISEVILGGN